MIDLDYKAAAPEAEAATRPLKDYLSECDLDDDLVELVYLRTSQINGCAYCVDLHSRKLRQFGKDERYVSSVVTWSEAPFFDDRERAALAWAEAVTGISSGGDERAADRARETFSDRELVDLTLAIGAMNAWNRMSIAFNRQPPIDAD